jgi:NADH-quinone oxidoreductase subunit E
VAKDGKPEMLKKARAGGADDLKMIKGVGPKLEALLNKLGVYHFDQVAGWRKAEVSWVDEHLEGFKGRVSRDNWVSQAKTLAKGGTTEFSGRVKKGGVY